MNRQPLARPITVADEAAAITIDAVVVVQYMSLVIVISRKGSGNRVGSRRDCHG